MRHIDSFCHFFPRASFADVGNRGRHRRHRQAHPGRAHNLGSRRALSHDGPVQGLQPGAVARPAAARRHGRPRPDAGVRARRQRRPGRAGGQVSGPLRRLCRRAANGQPRRRRQGGQRILLKGNANGLQLHTNVNGHCLDEPRFFPVFEIAAKSGKPILLHPARKPDVADFPAEKFSKYEIWTIFGWPYGPRHHGAADLFRRHDAAVRS